MKKLLIIVAFLVVAGIGYWIFCANSRNNNSGQSKTTDSAAQLTPDENTISELEREKPGLTQLPPVSAEEFGDFGNLSGTPAPQQPNSPATLGGTVDSSKYQGVIVKGGDVYRILVGKIEDKSEGSLELSDAFELVQNGNQASLQVAKPNTILIRSTEVVKWANLPDTNQMVKALLEYKKSQ